MKLRCQTPDQPEQHRHVLRQRRVQEMLVHLVRAGQELGEVLRPDRDHHRQPDRAPDRVAPADPVPEAEDAGRVDPPVRRPVERRGDGGEMPAGELAEARLQPGPRRARVGHRLDGGEGLRGDDDERPLRVEPLRACRGCAPRPRSRRSARAARRGRAPAPASPSPARGREPPMPMLTTSVNLPPSVAAIAPERTPSAKAAIRSSTPSTSGITSRPSTRIGLPERLRSATCSTARSSVVLILAPVNMRSRRSGTPRAAASSIEQRQRPRVDRRLGEVEQHVAEPHREAVEPVRVALEERRGCGYRARPRRPRSATARVRLPSISPLELAGVSREPRHLVPAARRVSSDASATHDPPTQSTFGSFR